jgi:threonine/homoserine/homoserine lactone efflux protein
MLSLETITAFFLASILLALAPGPDNIFVLTQSALHGKLSGVVVMLGLCTGILFHTAAVALGVAVIFQASAIAFTVLKMVGVCYLLYLAWQVFRAAPEQIQMQDSPKKSLGILYRRGIIMNVTNPKVSIFFLAFLPQFVDPQRGAVSLQMVSLGTIFIVSTIFIFGAVALIGGTLGDWLNRSAKAQRAMNWIAGTVFVGLALKLVTAER